MTRWFGLAVLWVSIANFQTLKANNAPPLVNNQQFALETTDPSVFREYQLDLNTSNFAPLQPGLDSVLQFVVNTLPELCRQSGGCAVKIDGAGNVKSHVEEFWFFDTPQSHFASSGYKVTQRNDYESEKVDLVIKNNNIDLKAVRQAQIEPRKSVPEKRVRDKIELDIFRCYSKYARSIMIKKTFKWKNRDEKLKTVNDLKEWFKNIDKVVPDGDEVGLVKVISQARHITEIPAQIGYKNVMIDTKFDIDVEYASLQEALQATAVPTRVQISFRVKKYPDSQFLEAIRHIFAQLQSYPAAMIC